MHSSTGILACVPAGTDRDVCATLPLRFGVQNSGTIKPPTLAVLAGCWLLILAAPATPAGELPVRRFQSAEDFSAWKGEGIEAGGSGPGGFQVLGGEQFRLFSPAGLAVPGEVKPYLRIRLRVHSPRYFQVFRPDPDGRMVPAAKAVLPPLDFNFRTFWVPLAEGQNQGGGFERLALVFGGRPGWVEIDSIELRPFSLGLYLGDQWRGFLLPRRLGLGSINSLNGPRIFGKSFIGWLNILAIAVFLSAMVFYLRARGQGKIRIVLRAALVLLTVWMVYDVRESYSQYQTVKEIHDLYVKPPPGEKTFPALGNFYGFVDLCREVIPETAQYNFYSTPMWPFDCRIQYFLYPRGIKSSTWNRYLPGEEVAYHAVYQHPGIRHDRATGRLIRRGEAGGSFISPPGKILSRLDANSFIFLEDEVSR